MEIEKEIVREVIRGDKHNHRKSANCKVLCIVISSGIYHLYFASNSSTIIVVPTPLSTVKEEIFVGEKFRTFPLEAFRTEFNFVLFG